MTTAAMNMHWVNYLPMGLFLGALLCLGWAGVEWVKVRLKIRRSVVVAERTAQAARTKGFIPVVYDPAIIFGHPAPFSDSEIEVLAEAVERSGNQPEMSGWDVNVANWKYQHRAQMEPPPDPPTSRPYIAGGGA